MKLRGKDDRKIIERLSAYRKGKRKYIHDDYQNELLTIMANQVVTKKLFQIRGRKYFSIMCDEYTDISNIEQLSFCTRSVDSDLCIYEDFIRFYELLNIKSDTIVSAIKDILIRMQLSLSNCRGQTYDGASNMLGRKSGVAEQFTAIQPKALVTHCQGHSLSLAVKDVTSERKILNDLMGTVGEICILIKFSPKREKMLSSIQENVEGVVDYEEHSRNKSSSLDKLCITRWTVRAACFLKIINNYDQLLDLWEMCLNEKLTTDVKARIIGCNAQMRTFLFYFSLLLGHRIYALTGNLSKTLQKEKMSAVSGQRLANLTVQTFQTMCNTESFKLFFETVVKKAKQHSLIEEPTKKTI